MIAMQQTTQEFKEIASEAALRSFLQNNNFRLADSRSHADQFVLGAFVGSLAGRQAKVTHRLFDEGAVELMKNQDRNQVLLEVEGMPPVEVRFRGNY